MKISLELDITVYQYRTRWQAYYGHSSGQLIVFNCLTEEEAITRLKEELKTSLDKLGEPFP